VIYFYIIFYIHLIILYIYTYILYIYIFFFSGILLCAINFSLGDVESEFKKAKIEPDIIDKAPIEKIEVYICKSIFTNIFIV